MKGIAICGLLLATAAFSQNSPSQKDQTSKSVTKQSTDAGQSTGKLHLRSTPANATVEIDGKNMGKTPLTVDLSVGSHVVVVTSSGYAPWKAEISIAGGELAGIGALLKKPGEPLDNR